MNVVVGANGEAHEMGIGGVGVHGLYGGVTCCINRPCRAEIVYHSQPGLSAVLVRWISADCNEVLFLSEFAHVVEGDEEA